VGLDRSEGVEGNCEHCSKVKEALMKAYRYGSRAVFVTITRGSGRKEEEVKVLHKDIKNSEGKNWGLSSVHQYPDGKQGGAVTER